ncbi:tyrosine-protein phosphatase [Staphylococcus sp. HMSC061G12]|uniref:tyrosine-protein phosphatase n=1 Tax=Staphylococcus sp. HMSC061G12 TaxID=1739441 RepID=UPI0008A8CEFF|nr:CpsB/CapC family capsule biosynthesis tyrosine phosphatase [Staphylococcus sp. HMSC061G12]OHR60350.1 capsular biosynthesis protein [Staphylococcus sp. HMSC061G12]
MIDIHNHIIPNIDDGPKNEEEMIALIRQAASQNIKGIVATPHHLHHRYNNDFSEVEKYVNEINNNELIKEMGITIYPGQEIRVSDQLLVDLDHGRVKGINYSSYLLLELPSNSIPNYIQRLIYEVQTRGYTPVIVHPERNKLIAQDINLLYGLINIGALSQITVSSLSGDMGKKLQKISIDLLEHNLVHFIASDAHNTSTRPFKAVSLFQNKKLKNYETEINKLYMNNERLIRNRRINKLRPIEYKRKKIFGLFSK